MNIPVKNHLLSGIIAGILVMTLAYGLFSLLLLIPFLHNFPNLLLMRFWLVGKRLEKAGKGVLLVTFVVIIAVFIIFGT